MPFRCGVQHHGNSIPNKNNCSLSFDWNSVFFNTQSSLKKKKDNHFNITTNVPGLLDLCVSWSLRLNRMFYKGVLACKHLAAWESVWRREPRCRAEWSPYAARLVALCMVMCVWRWGGSADRASPSPVKGSQTHLFQPNVWFDSPAFAMLKKKRTLSIYVCYETASSVVH